MGLDYFYGNKSYSKNIVSTKSLYFGDVYRQPKRKRCFSNDKSHIDKDDINNKSIHKYFSKTTAQDNISKFLYSNKKAHKNNSINNNKADESQNNSSSFSTISSNSNSSNDNIKNNSISLHNENMFPPNNKIKNNKNLRKSYYQRLVNTNISKWNKEMIKNNTIFIFDWDDTLFFTTHLNPSKNSTFFYESKTEKRLMNTIEFYVSEILNKALSKGTVLIITNSSDGWVHACAKFYYPNLLPILDKIKIISARELYQDEYPAEPITWKVKTFNDLKKKFNFEKCRVSNIICIGDDNSEIIAAKKLGESFKNCLVKTIKFRDKPNLTDLIKQIILINEQILRVYNYPKSLTIQVDKKKNPNK